MKPHILENSGVAIIYNPKMMLENLECTHGSNLSITLMM